MWHVGPELDLATLTPGELLWLVALGVEENGGPTAYVLALRALADQLEGMGAFLSEPGIERVKVCEKGRTVLAGVLQSVPLCGLIFGLIFLLRFRHKFRVRSCECVSSGSADLCDLRSQWL
jgi:hypothetical protein